MHRLARLAAAGDIVAVQGIFAVLGLVGHLALHV
jgi:hypothetical protein